MSMQMSMQDRSRLVSLSCGRVFIRDLAPPTGAGGAALPPIVLLHGLLVTSHSFRRLVPALSRSRRVIAVDLPGCGDSDRPEPAQASDYAVPWLADRVAELLEHLELPPVDLLGHSFGGTVALSVAALHAPKVRRLLLADPVAFSMELTLEGRLALLPRLGPYVFKTLYRRADLRRHLARVLFQPQRADATALNVYWDRLSRHGGREAAYAMLCHLTLLSWLEPQLETIGVPTLVMWGEHDALMPVAQGERLVAMMKDASLAVLERCGHAMPEECPEAMLALLDGFCRGQAE